MRWLNILAFSLTVLCGGQAFAAEIPASNSPDLLSPNLKVIERPKTHYRTDSTIHYRVEVHLPNYEFPIHLTSPEVDLKNLELLGVRLETSRSAGDELLHSQILDFTFRPLTAGPALIKEIDLKWLDDEGRLVESFSIPAQDIKIKGKAWNAAVILLTGLFLILLAAFGFVFFKRRRAASDPAPAQEEKLFSELIRERFEEAFTAWQSMGDDSRFLSEIHQISADFFSQELHWQSPPESYNDLRKKAQARWSTGVGDEIALLMKEFEQIRFSGSSRHPGDIQKIYSSISKYILDKRVIPKH